MSEQGIAPAEPAKRRTADRYKAVNGAWPKPKNELPKMLAQEAITAFRILYRHRFGKSWKGQVKAVKGSHRRTWNYGRVSVRRKGALTSEPRFIVAPDQGWHDFIHDLSHWMHRQQYPGQSPHRGGCHAAVEMDLIEQVVNRGWLDGGLKRKPRESAPKPPTDMKAKRHTAVLVRIKTWESKRKRAETALKKLRRQKAYYERTIH